MNVRPRLRVLLLALATAAVALASDHGDHAIAPADITDLHVFSDGENLVTALSVRGVFQEGVTYEIRIDNDAEVDFYDPVANQLRGGTIVDPDSIEEDVTFRFRFRDGGSPFVQRKVAGGPVDEIHCEWPTCFTGRRDDPFIRSSAIGRNVSAIVLATPLSEVIDGQATLLVWAATRLDLETNPENHQDEMFGRALGGGGSALTNTLHPSEHLRVAGVPPNVTIYDTLREARFPNGRDLRDDVVDLACAVDTNGDGVPDQQCVAYCTDLQRAATSCFAPTPTKPCAAPATMTCIEPTPTCAAPAAPKCGCCVEPATENDVDYLADFPYLAPAH